MRKQSRKMIYSPVEHIPLGEAVNVNGEQMLRVKKANSNVYEDVPVVALLSGIYGGGSTQEAQVRLPQG